MKKEEKDLEKKEEIMPLTLRMNHAKTDIINFINKVSEDYQIGNPFLLEILVGGIYNEIVAMQKNEIDNYELSKVEENKDDRENKEV